MTDLDRLSAGKYLLLTTFRRNGQPVGTPVWVVRDGDALAVWTAADSGKVKRIRRSGEVIVAPCDVRGNPLGPAVPGHASIDDPATTERVKDLVRRKYGILGRLTLLGSRLRRGSAGTVGVHVTLRSPSGS